jgi:hypothetical protein
MNRVVWALLLALAPLSLQAQASKAKDKGQPVPKSSLPPAGMCRIWVDNVPAARQPAPTDCSTAIRNKPPNARVLFPAERNRRATPSRTPAPKAQAGDTARRKPPGGERRRP